MTQPSPAAPTPPPDAMTLENWMKARHNQLSLLLLILAAGFAAIPVWQLIRSFRELPVNYPLMVWGGALTLLALFGGIYLRLAAGQNLAEGQYRILALGLGGGVGLATFVLGISLPLGPWSPYFVPGPEVENPVPILQLWKDNWWRLALVCLAALGGLVLMFASLQLGRSIERASASMRRLLYGYNAVLTGLLLFAILGLANLLAYVPMKPFSYLSEDLDWTPSQLHSLSDPTIELLKQIKGQIKVTILMPVGDRLFTDVNQMIDNARKYNSNISRAILSPDENRIDFREVVRQYRSHFEGNKLTRQDEETGQIGIVIEYTEQGKKDTVGIHYSDLQRFKPSERGGGSRYVFKGEGQFHRALQKLTEKTPTKLYFTQGHGELTLTEGLATLRERLDSRGFFEFKPVNPATDTLKDADVLVIARPMQAFSADALKAIRSYLKDGKGKLIALFDLETVGNEMLRTGLEDLLKEYNVEVGMTSRLLSFPPVPPSICAVGSGSKSNNPVAQAFGGRHRRVLSFVNARPVRPSGAAQGGFQADPFLTTLSNYPVWEESNLTASAGSLLASYRKSEKPPPDLREVPVAVAVSEGQANPRLPAGHVPVTEQTPRLMVFGHGSWISDEGLGLSGGSAVDLFYSCVSWLRGRVDIGVDTSAEKERSEYTLKDKIKAGTGQEARLRWLPLGLLILTIVALGGGVWVVRRR